MLVPAEGLGLVPAEGLGLVPAAGLGLVPAEGLGLVPAEGLVSAEGLVPVVGLCDSLALHCAFRTLIGRHLPRGRLSLVMYALHSQSARA